MPSWRKKEEEEKETRPTTLVVVDAVKGRFLAASGKARVSSVEKPTPRQGVPVMEGDSANSKTS